MDLKALTTALIVAFLTVIVDAVFHFHYIYVITVLAVLSYAFVRAVENPVSAPSKQAAPCSLLALIPQPTDEITDVPVRCQEDACRMAIHMLLEALPVPPHLSVSIHRGPGQGWVHLVWTVNRKLAPMPEPVQQALDTLAAHGPVWIADIPRKTECHLLLPRA